MVVVALLLVSCGGVVKRPADEDQLPVAPPVETNEPDDGVLRIRGTLEDSETNTGRPGEVRAYRSNADGTYTLLDADITDGAGNFALSFQDDAEVFDLQARLKDGAADASYVRTLTLPMESASELLVRAVPYTGLNGDAVETDITVERFREYIIETLEDKYKGLRKWKPGEPKGIEVLHEYLPPPGPPGVPCSICAPGSFMQDDLDAIEEVLRSEEGRALFGDREVPIRIDGPSTPDSEKHYSYYENGGGLAVDDGWIIIFPSGYTDDDGAFGFGRRRTYANNPYLRSGDMALKIDNKEAMAQAEKHQPGWLKILVLHELGHASYSSHTLTLRRLQSMMAPGGFFGQPRCPSMCFADRKALKIVNEETFPAGSRVGDVLLGLGWHD